MAPDQILLSVTHTKNTKRGNSRQPKQECEKSATTMSHEEGSKEMKRWVCSCSSCNGGCRNCSTTGGDSLKKTMSTYLGLSFAVFLGLLPKNTLPYITSLQSRNRVLALRLFEAEEQLMQIRARRREDGRANARAAEVFAEHRNVWRETEQNLLNRIEDAHTVELELRAKVESLERELLIAKSANAVVAPSDDATAGEEERAIGVGDGELEREVNGEEVDEEEGMVLHQEGVQEGLELDEIAAMIYQQRLRMELPPMDSHGLGSQNIANYHCTDANWFDLADPSTKPIPTHIPWQGLNYDTVESVSGLKHVTPRESPWKIDLASSGVPNKLKLLEEELVNLENLGKGDLSKLPSLMRKQARRYQSLSARLDDLCKRMRGSDPYDPALGAELRIQRQTEFLMEAKHLQHRATETRMKLNSVQSETLNIGSFRFGEELSVEAKLRTKRSLDSIRNNFKEIQRNLEVWLARILGDLEGMLARDGASRMREYTNFW